MCKPRGLFVVWIAILLACQPVTAQSAGDRVRITTATDTIVGDLSRISENGLVLVFEDGELREFVNDEVQQLEIHKQEDYWEGGLLAGLLLGGAVAQVTAREVPYRVEGDWLDCRLGHCLKEGTRKEATTVGTVAVVAGAAVGFLVGRSLKSDTWEEVPHPADMNRLVLSPIVDVQSGFAMVIVGMSIRF